MSNEKHQNGDSRTPKAPTAKALLPQPLLSIAIVNEYIFIQIYKLKYFFLDNQEFDLTHSVPKNFIYQMIY